MADATTESNSRQQEMVLHRCAVFGTRKYYPGYPATLEYLKDMITSSISEGFYTFLTCANDGYELDAARFILGLKKTDKRIRLVIVIPRPNPNKNWNTLMLFEEVCNSADFVKVISKSDDPEAVDKATKWILSNCRRIISATSGPNSGIKRLSGNDLSEKECINVSVIWSEADEMFVRTVPHPAKKAETAPIDQPGLKFPYNLLSDLLESEQLNEEQFPDDIIDRLFSILSKYDDRTRQILCLRYSDRLTLQQIGDQFGLSRERIRQLINKGLRRLRYKKHMNILLGKDEENGPAERNYDLPDNEDGSNKRKEWTEEEISQVKAEILSFPIDQVAAKHGRSPISLAHLIKTHDLLPEEQYFMYCYGAVHPKNDSERVGNTGAKWTESEEEQLLDLYKNGFPLDEIAKIHKRTIGGIVSRLSRLTGQDRDYFTRIPTGDLPSAEASEDVEVDEIVPSETTMSISGLARLLSMKTKKASGLTVRYADIAEWLVASGDLLDDKSDEKAIKIPTLQGQQHGIKRGERINASGLPYVGVYLEPEGQQYIIDNLDSILKFIKERPTYPA